MSHVPRWGSIIGLVVGLAIVGGIGYAFWSEVQRQRPDATEFADVIRTRYGQTRVSDNQATELPDADDDPSNGPSDAKVTIIAFEDFACPFSGKAWLVEKQMKEEFGDQVRFVYRDSPIPSIHPIATEAAQAGECADQQGHFWEMHDLLFTYQESLSSLKIDELAVKAGLNLTTFATCMNDPQTAQEVQNDMDDGVRAGVSGTPTYFFNGILVEGNIPAEAFRTAINYFL